ncbi:MAG: peptidylprolyl isomerase [Candidatus Neomarinimicrobiota bacterium]|tara:strand:- start:245 stop:889 length:645 start_codon:yes stop_codon:yes gene_type:complete
MIKKAINIMILLPIFFSGCNKKEKVEPIALKSTKKVESKPLKEVGIISTQFGDMVVEFYERAAPKHVESFKLHAKSGYYNGTIFHRVIPGFMIQGGDLNTKGENKSIYGQGGHAAKFYGIGKEDNPSSWDIPAEFNDIKHTLGILSMARTSDPNSAGSQFFICAGDASHLDAQYTVFGKVIEGLGIIDKIVNMPRDNRDNPINRVEMTVALESR